MNNNLKITRGCKSHGIHNSLMDRREDLPEQKLNGMKSKGNKSSKTGWDGHYRVRKITENVQNNKMEEEKEIEMDREKKGGGERKG